MVAVFHAGPKGDALHESLRHGSQVVAAGGDVNPDVRTNADEQREGAEEALASVYGVENVGFASQEDFLGEKPVMIDGLCCKLCRSFCRAAIYQIEIHDSAPTVSIGGRAPWVICRHSRAAGRPRRMYPAF